MALYVVFRAVKEQLFHSAVEIEALSSLLDLTISLPDACFLGIPVLFKALGAALNEALQDSKMILLTQLLNFLVMIAFAAVTFVLPESDIFATYEAFVISQGFIGVASVVYYLKVVDFK